MELIRKNDSIMNGHINKYICLICGRLIIILEKESSHASAICHKTFMSSTIYSDGYFVCNNCKLYNKN